jgi:hypothetical protein
MNLKDIVEKMGLEVKCAAHRLECHVRGGYASDLLSDVLANARDGDLWVTLQTHQNTVAVASMKGLCGIVMINGREPEDETIEKAEAEQIPIMTSSLPSFELIGRLHALGICGMRDGSQEI